MSKVGAVTRRSLKSRSMLRQWFHTLLISALTLAGTTSVEAKKSITRKGSSGATGSKTGPDLHAGDMKRAAPERADGHTSIFFLDLGLRHDLGTFTQRETVGRASVTDETGDVRAMGPLLRLGILHPLANRFRVGVAFGYGFNYTLVERQEDRNSDRDPEKTHLGQLVTADLRAEWSPYLTSGLSLVLSPIATLTAISPGGDLKETTDSLEESHNVWSGPRLGWAFGGEAGLRYMFKPWFSFKLVGGYSYSRQGLLRATRKGDAADSKRIWHGSWSRVTALLGTEAHF